MSAFAVRNFRIFLKNQDLITQMIHWPAPDVAAPLYLHL